MHGKLVARCLLVCWPLVFVVASLPGAEDYDAVYGGGAHPMLTVATGSPGELCLLEALATAFNNRHGTTICWKKAGSGAALGLLKEQKVDVALVHAPALEEEAVEQGWATSRTLIGFNEFYIVGPKNDPALVAQAVSAADAYARIAGARATFLSRGDSSGTHKKELAIWKAAGIQPTGNWYRCTKDFMLPTLHQANAERSYFMIDSSTWMAARADVPNLDLLFRGDLVLINRYHALCRPERTTAAQRHASTFVTFLSSEEAQEIIRDFGKDRYGGPLYGDARRARALAD